MRVIVFFDLPTETLANKRDYRQFRKALIKKGFLMIQESVYSKLALNQTNAGLIEAYVRDNKPSDGIVQMLTITEKQYSKMEFIVGKKNSSVLDSDERLIVL